MSTYFLRYLFLCVSTLHKTEVSERQVGVFPFDHVRVLLVLISGILRRERGDTGLHHRAVVLSVSTEELDLVGDDLRRALRTPLPVGEVTVVYATFDKEVCSLSYILLHKHRRVLECRNLMPIRRRWHLFAVGLDIPTLVGGERKCGDTTLPIEVLYLRIFTYVAYEYDFVVRHNYTKSKIHIFCHRYQI